MKLKYLDLTFENCEHVCIDGKYIGAFLVDDIHTYISRVACNAIEKMETCHTFAVEIHKDADKKYDSFGRESESTAFKRITEWNDITHVDFVLEETYVNNGEAPKTEEYCYGVCWTGDSDVENESQTSYISGPGHMYIVISDKNKFEDLFDKEDIEDAAYVDFHMEMCDIGDEYGDPNRYTNV